MGFTELQTLTGKLTTQLTSITGSGTSVLKTVREIRQGDYENILELVPDLGPLPAAVVSLAEITFPEEYAGVIRNVTYNVTIIEQTDTLSGQTALLDQVLLKFSGSLTGQPLVVDQIPFLVEEVKRLDYPQDYQAWNMKITAKQSF